jgi:hypothetical protein
MKTPLITATDLSAFLESRSATLTSPNIYFGNEDPNLHQEDIDSLVTSIEAIQKRIDKEATGSQSAFEQFDFELAMILPGIIDRLDASTVLDPGFWAYLSWRLHLVIEWRHPEGKFINFGVNFGNLQESLLGRSYLRAKIGKTQEYISVPGSDLWRSHIIRVKAGNSSPISQALLALVRDHKLPVKDVRLIARRINAYRSNVIFELLTEAGASKAIGLIWDEYDKSRKHPS